MPSKTKSKPDALRKALANFRNKLDDLFEKHVFLIPSYKKFEEPRYGHETWEQSYWYLCSRNSVLWYELEIATLLNDLRARAHRFSSTTHKSKSDSLFSSVKLRHSLKNSIEHISAIGSENLRRACAVEPEDWARMTSGLSALLEIIEGASEAHEAELEAAQTEGEKRRGSRLRGRQPDWALLLVLIELSDLYAKITGREPTSTRNPDVYEPDEDIQDEAHQLPYTSEFDRFVAAAMDYIYADLKDSPGCRATGDATRRAIGEEGMEVDPTPVELPGRDASFRMMAEPKAE